LQQNLDYILKTRRADYELTHGVRVRMNIEPLKPNNKMSKADRIYTTLGSFVRLGNVQIIESQCRELILQMDTFTGKGNEDDNVVDAAAYLFPLANIFGARRKKVNPSVGGGMTLNDLIKRHKRKSNDWRAQFNGYSSTSSRAS
jgi:hypothetical protein